MKYRVTHITTYQSTEAVSVCHNLAWLTPRSTDHQHCEYHRVGVSPHPSTRGVRDDCFGNQVTHLSFNEGYEDLEVRAVSRVDITPTPPPSGDSPSWESVKAQLSASSEGRNLDALQFTFGSPRIRLSAELVEFGVPFFPAGAPIVDCVRRLTAHLHENFEYDDRATVVTTPPQEVLTRRKGVCQDFAHLQVGVLRSLGLPARYVSGYLRTYPPEGQTRLIGADASHAWLGVYCGADLGWVDVDPTNNLFPSDEHITVAWGRDYSDVTPLRGVFVGGGEHSLDVAVQVEPL